MQVNTDGRYLAYVSYQHGQYSLWVRQMATTSAVQVVPPATAVIVDVTFTPDGNFLVYTVRKTGDANGKAFQVPALGGTPRRLLNAIDTGVNFSPDGTTLAYSTVHNVTNEATLMLAHADGSAPPNFGGPQEPLRSFGLDR